jgi:hypothetical protein
MRPYSSFPHGRVASFAMVCVCAVLGFAAIELGYRIHSQRPVLVLESWRAWRIEYQTFGARGNFDPLLGWVPKPWYEEDGYNTTTHGIRRNAEDKGEVATGAILAVGGWFTDGGPDLDDDETWPAQLEGLIGKPVLNAGVSGYATDQIVLRAEQLLPLLRPKTLLVGFVGEEIPRASFSSFGAPKPYFTLEGGELKYHPPGPIIVDDPNGPAWQARVRDVLGYSAVLDVVLSLIAPRYWMGTAGEPVFQKIDNDPVGVTCALLRRLKGRTDADGVRLLLFMQHGRQAVAGKQEPGEDAKQVAACAQAAGIEVVDHFEALRATAAANADALGELYLEGDEVPMSPKGNRQAAELLARALDKAQ